MTAASLAHQAILTPALPLRHEQSSAACGLFPKAHVPIPLNAHGCGNGHFGTTLQT